MAVIAWLTDRSHRPPILRARDSVDAQFNQGNFCHDEINISRMREEAFASSERTSSDGKSRKVRAMDKSYRAPAEAKHLRLWHARYLVAPPFLRRRRHDPLREVKELTHPAYWLNAT